MKKVVFNWSGGKDSSLCLYKLLSNPDYSVSSLLTAVNQQKSRVSMHGTRKEMIQTQARHIGIPLQCIMLPDKLDMDQYNRIMLKSLQPFCEQGVLYGAFGDILLDGLRNYRENMLDKIGMEAIFPLWYNDTAQLAGEFVELGFKAVISSVDGSKLDRSFVGREYDRQFLQDLPKTVDPCGEYGEFHSFVYDGPIFHTPVPFKKGEVVERKYESSGDSDHSFTGNSGEGSYSYWFIDILP